MKLCPKCLREMFRECFARSSRSTDGLQSWCRDCKRKSARVWLRKVAPEALERHRAMRKLRRPRYRVTEAISHKDWLARNRERSRGYDAKRRQTPERREWTADYWRRWKLANPERTREIAQKGQLVRRARKANAFVEAVEPLVVLDRGHGICGICDEPVDPSDFHVDHIIPLSRGGEHSYANTQPAHPNCNISKGARILEAAA